MAVELLELENVLSSKQYILTMQEDIALYDWKYKAVQSLIKGSLLGIGLPWCATKKLPMIVRAVISSGVGSAMGVWGMHSSIDKGVDHILALEDSTVQRELADIMVKKYWNDPWIMQLISKHFYLEKVFDDSTSDHPKVRWRYRNFFSDDAGHGQRRKQDGESHNDSQGDSQSESQGDSSSNSQRNPSGIRTNPRKDFERRKFNFESKQAPMNPAVDAMDPFDCFFGYPAMEEIPHPNSSPTSPRMHTRYPRRARRRHQMRRQDVLLTPSMHNL